MSQFLENNQQQMNLMDKAVLELGAGTGLLSTVASLLGKSMRIESMQFTQCVPLHLETEVIA